MFTRKDKIKTISKLNREGETVTTGRNYSSKKMFSGI